MRKNKQSLRPSRNNLSIYRVIGEDLAILKENLAKARKSLGHKKEVFSSTGALTVIEWPKLPSNFQARNLLKCAVPMNSVLSLSKCVAFNPNVVESYLEDGEISPFGQGHLAEHILLPYLEYAHDHNERVDAETAATLDGRILTVITGQYDHAALKEITSHIWHWLGKAVRRGTFPTEAQLRTAIRLRILVIKNKEVTLEMINEILAAD